MSAPTAAQNKDRKANTEKIMSNIMAPGAGEISKKREAELQKAANYGRGVQFVEGSPKVKGLTQKGGKPVFRTGATAADYTGRITANAPTGGELIKDAGRALFGGKADDTQIRKDTGLSKNILPEPEKAEGIVPTFVKKGGAIGSIVSSVLKKPKKEKVTTQSILAKQRQGFKDDPYSVPSLLLGGSKQNLGDS
jgi:hypothetical protein|tara:strand:- start:1358 stop:1939 length:582 start_codon:yes stop_codon:yes gene_type:complete